MDLLNTHYFDPYLNNRKKPGVDQSVVHWDPGGVLPSVFDGLHFRALQWGPVSFYCKATWGLSLQTLSVYSM